MFTQGVKIISLLSDPFGWGWNLFGTAGLLRAPILPSMSMVWHTQVGLILFGHIVSVYIAHVEARSEEHTSELRSLMRISYAVFCLKKKKNTTHTHVHDV